MKTLLQHCHKLNLAYCDNITDHSIMELGLCAVLDLTGCHRITDIGVKALSHCNVLHLWQCNNLTQECIYNLRVLGVIVHFSR